MSSVEIHRMFGRFGASAAHANEVTRQTNNAAIELRGLIMSLITPGQTVTTQRYEYSSTTQI
jgi:hypothetical protein